MWVSPENVPVSKPPLATMLLLAEPLVTSVLIVEVPLLPCAIVKPTGLALERKHSSRSHWR